MTDEIGFKILKQAGLVCDKSKFNASNTITGGLNSGIRLVEADDTQYVIKTYPEDLMRRRLNTEFQFLTLADNVAVQNVPKPIKKLLSLNVGVYSYLNGNKIHTATDANVLASADFIIEINQKMETVSNKFGLASDHFTSYENLVESIERRLFSLRSSAQLHSEIYDQTVNELYKKFQKITYTKSTIKKELNDNLRQMKQIVSPSDFGLHNALQNEKTVQFLDFEYAGRDNCLKLVCDFYCQPRIPISHFQFKQFIGRLNNRLLHINNLLEISEQFLPLFRLKWSCIILNQVNKLGDRGFVNKNSSNDQIEKSRDYLRQY